MLLNYSWWSEAFAVEMKLQAAAVLMVKPENIRVNFEVKDGKVLTSLGASGVDDVEPDEVVQVLQKVYLDRKNAFNVLLRELDMQWGDYYGEAHTG